MKQQNGSRVLYTAAALAMVSVIPRARAQSFTIDGNLDSAYGAPLAVQTNNTQFGDSTVGDGTSNGGSELDAAYGNISNGTLYLFLAGNLENNYNHLNIFIADGRTTGQSTVNTSGTIGATYGSVFSPGFLATYALDINGGGTPFTEYVNASDLTQTPGTTTYLGSFPGNSSTATSLTSANGTLTFAFNNSNAAGVVGGQSNASSAAAAAVTTGLEVAIPLTVFGGLHGNIKVLADITGGGDDYPSNQFLPGLPTIEPNLGSGSSTYSLASNSNGFNFGSVPNQFFTVPAPVATSINTTWLATGNGSWSGAANWSAGVPNSQSAVAHFNSSNAAAATVTLDGSKTVGQIEFNSPNSYTIAQGSGGTLTFDDTGDLGGVNPLVTVDAGVHTISVPVNLVSGLTVTIPTSTSGLVISGNIAGSGGITKSGAGNLSLSGSNSYSGNILILSGNLEADNNAALATGQVTIGDPTADGLNAALNVGTTGLNIKNAIVTNQDDSERDDERGINGTYNTGNSTISSTITVNGSVAFSVISPATLTISGPIVNGTDTSTVATHDLLINAPATGSPGLVILSGTSTYTGITAINTGSLELTASATLTSPTLYVNNATQLILGPQTGSGILVRNLTPTLAIQTGGLATVAQASNHSSRQLVVISGGLSIAGGIGAWTGQLDVTNNDLEIVNGSIVNVDDQIHQGLTGGATAFSGEGIISSTAAADTTHSMALGAIPNTVDGTNPIFGTGTARGLFDGANPSASDVLVKYTYFGDANLDGVVDGTDYSRIDNGFLSQLSASPLTGWYNGDFNYDGVIDGSDYTLIDNSYNSQGSSLAAELAAPSAAVTDQIGSGSSAVPEPTSLSLLGMGAAVLLGRRRAGKR